MRIIHTSDWHIGQSFYGYDRLDEHSAVIDAIFDIVIDSQADALIVSGDIFDLPQPSVSAQRLFADKLMTLRQKCPELCIIVTAGNHDSATRHEAFVPLWEAAHIDMVGTVEKDNYDHNIVKIKNKGFVAAVPYISPRFIPDGYFEHLLARISELNTESLPVVMMAHLSVANCDSEGHQSDEIIIGGVEACALKDMEVDYDYLALGHIHKPQQLSDKARYSGAPLAISFDEPFAHSVTIVDFGAHGEPISIATKEIEPPRPIVTLPAKGGADWDDAMALLNDFPSDIPAYIRLNVNEGTLPPDARAQAIIACEGKECDFCIINLVRRRTTAEMAENTDFTISELQTKNPTEIARIYSDRQGVDFDAELTEMFNIALSNIEETVRNL